MRDAQGVNVSLRVKSPLSVNLFVAPNKSLSVNPQVSSNPLVETKLEDPVNESDDSNSAVSLKPDVPLNGSVGAKLRDNVKSAEASNSDDISKAFERVNSVLIVMSELCVKSLEPVKYVDSEKSPLIDKTQEGLNKLETVKSLDIVKALDSVNTL